MAQRVLLVSNMWRAHEYSSPVEYQLGVKIEVVDSRRAALAALGRCEYSVLLLDQSTLDSDLPGLELLWQEAGRAIPIEVSLGVSNWTRVLREVRTGLHRREREQLLAQRSALQMIEGALSTTITGLLLNSQLILQEPTLDTRIIVQLHRVVELATELAEKVRPHEWQ